MNSPSSSLNPERSGLSTIGRPELGLALDSRSFVPFYEQITEQVRTLIRTKKLKAGDSFYSEGEVSRTLGISKMPVRQAFQKLRSEGLLIITRGKRPIIGPGRVPWDFQELRGFTEEMRRRGLSPSARVLSLELQSPDTEIGTALNLGDGRQVYRLKRLRLVAEQPVAVVTSFLPAHVFPGLDKLDLETQSLYHVMEQVYQRPLGWAQEVIGAVTAGSEEAAILQAMPGSALLVVKETTYDIQQTPVEYSVSLLRGDRYTATVVSVRKK
jgi:GntR family transcriptional regulator